MNIVHIISSIDPAGGGPQAVIMRMAAAQCTLGHSVHVVSYSGREVEERSIRAAANIPGFQQISWHLLPTPDRLERLFCIMGAKLLDKLLPAMDFVHLHGVWEPILLKASKMARTIHLPYCITPHGMLDSWSMRQKAVKKRIALRLGYRGMLNGARFIQALNADEARLMGPLALKAPTAIIPNGIFVEEFIPLPRRGTFRRRLGLPADRRFILFLSRLHKKKGLDILAKAFHQVATALPDIDLVVAGPDEGARNDFLAQIKTLGIEDRVIMPGPLYGQDKIGALVDAACFCLPSRQEGFSVAIAEALACGVPVVISDACHFPEVAVSGAGTVVPLDPTAIGKALTNVLANVRRAKAMGENGRTLVRENYTWSRIGQMTVEHYAGLGPQAHGVRTYDGASARFPTAQA